VGISILFEDNDLIVVSKPAGLIVGDPEREDSLEFVTARQIGRKVFPFHRLDRATSGVVLLGKTRVHAAAITQAFEKKRIRKAYLAVVNGEWPSQLGRIDTMIEGREAVTTFRRIAVGSSESLIEALPKTGRTHQIRIHCASAGHPIKGDTIYGLSNELDQKPAAPREQALHAYRLTFNHPGSGEAVSIMDLPHHWRETYLADFDWDAIQKKFNTPKSE